MFNLNFDYKSRFRILKGGKISLVVSAILGSAIVSFAAPTGGTVTSGTATISQDGLVTNINQATGKATINWNSFSIASNETVNFNQPNVNSITLNRVIGNERSVIDGALNANGQVWLLNSNGILFNSTAKINTAGILATTKSISDTDFQAGNYKFTGNSTESVVNMGEIEISNSGYATLLADSVSNEGTIKAYQGDIVFANGEATINLNGNSMVGITVDKGVLDSLIENKGALIADGGKIVMTSKAADEILKNVVNNSGVVEAKSFDDMFGSVEMIAEGGYIENSGTIDVSSDNGKGGTATVTGYHTMITDTGVINADGAKGGGKIQVGGSWQNSDTSVYQAVGTIVAKGAKLTANATDNGDGGTIVAWSDVTNEDSVTRAYGTFEAKGGVNGGDGGKIETSGYWLDTKGIDFVSTLAPKGKNGTWLLDPSDIEINTFNQTGGFYNQGGTYGKIWKTDDSASSSIVDVNELQTHLSSTGVIINAADYGTGGTGRITVNTPITWSSSNPLYFIAKSLVVNNDITNTNADLIVHLAGGQFFLPSATINTKLLDIRQAHGDLNGSVRGDIKLTSSQIALKGNSNTYYNIYVDDSSTIYLEGDMGYRAVNLQTSNAKLRLNSSNVIINGLIGSGIVEGDSSKTITVKYGDFYGNFSSSNLVIGGNSQTYSGQTYGANSVTINSGATFNGTSAGKSMTNNGIWDVGNGSSATSYSGGGTLNVNNSLSLTNFSGTGPIAIASGQTLSLYQSSDVTYGGYLSGYGALNIYSNSGYRNMTFSGNNSGYYGNVTVGSNMAAVLSNSYGLGASSGTITVNSGGTLYLNGVTSYKPLYINGTGQANYGGALYGYGTYSGAITLSGDSIVRGNNNLTLDSVSGSSYALTLNNPYITYLNGVNVYSLTTDSGGSTYIQGNITTQATQTYNDAVVINSNNKTLSSTSYGQFYFNGGLTGNNTNLSLLGGNLHGAGTLEIAGSIVLDGSSSLSLKGSVANTYLTTDSATISTPSLGLYNLQDVGIVEGNGIFSDINTIAASNMSGSFYYRDSGALAIGSVNGINGISSSGTINISTQSDDLTLAQNISTSDTSSDAVILNAGESTNAGTATGGNIIISGTPSVTVGTGGIAKLYTGSIDDSTGLTDLVGLGSGNFRYNSDESFVGYTKALSSGVNGIYREQPTIGATVSSASKVYDGAIYSGTPTLDYTMVNGDTAGSDITIGTFELSGDGIDPSSINAGTYTISAALSGFSNTLGYANPTAANPGTLTIEKRILGLSGTRVYDGTTDITSDILGNITNLVGDETIVLGDIGTVTSKTAENGKVVDTSGLTLGDGLNGGLANNYTLTGGIYTVDITKADISSIDGITASNKTYDGTTTATLDASSTVTFNGKIGSDVLSVASSSGNFEDKNVADGKTVNITGLTLSGADAQNYNLIDDTATTTANITPRAITLSSATADNREYNGVADTSASISSWGSFNNLIAEDSSDVTIDTTNIVANFDDGNVANDKAVNINGIALSGEEASNYSIVGTFATTANITRKTLGISFDTAPTKVYDGTTTISGGGNLSLTGIIDSEDVNLDMTGATYEYANKNVGVNKSLVFKNVNLTGGQSGNYILDTSNVPTNASITRLDTVTWTGGGDGTNWFDAANWAGRAVPDLSNVANVIIPDSVTISFDTSGASMGVDTSAVNIETLGSLGSLTMSAGTLNVQNGITLNTLTQSGGTIGGATDVVVDNLVQSGGDIANIGNLQVNNSFSQSNTAGTITVDGDVTITQTSGDVVIGNISNNGSLNVDVISGNIAQLSGASLSPNGLASFSASGNIDLTNSGNDFSNISLNGMNVSFRDDTGGIVLDDITTSGTFSATSSNGSITQTNDSVLSLAGETTLDAGTSGVTLANATNDFQSAVNISAAQDVVLADINGIELGDINTIGTLDVSAQDDITQKVGTALNTGGDIALASTNGDITLDSSTNNFGGSFSASGENISLSNYDHPLSLGNIVSQTSLDISTNNQAITQAVGSTLTSNGSANLDAGTSNISLTNDGNDFTTLALSGNDIAFKDSVGGVVLDDITTSGTFSATSSNGSITQTNDSVLSLAGETTLDAGTSGVTLANATNDFQSAVNISAAQDVVLADINGIELGDINTIGTLDVSAQDDITQKVGTALNTGGDIALASTNGDITLDSSTNNFGGSFSASGENISLSNYDHPLSLGNIVSQTSLDISTNNQAITQAIDSKLILKGLSAIDAGASTINLGNKGNDYEEITLTGSSVTAAETLQEEAIRLEEERKANSNMLNSSSISSALTKDIQNMESSFKQVSNNGLNSMDMKQQPSFIGQAFQSNGVDSQKVSFVSSVPENNDKIERVSYNELLELNNTTKQNQDEQNSGDNNLVDSELKIPVAQDSIVFLVEGGLNLPIGLEQEFYIVKDNKNEQNR